MRLSTIPPAVPADCALPAPLAELAAVYDRIEAEQQPWQEATPWHCPEGCGSCCESFEPDILEIEALWLAAWILEQDITRCESPQGTITGEAAEGTQSAIGARQRALCGEETTAEALLARNSHRDGCVLARDEGPWFCSVYGGRPLICRLFGFSGDRDKTGKARFRPCSRLNGANDARTESACSRPAIGEAELIERFGRLPPLMGDLASLADSILPGSNTREPLREALPKALAKLRMLWRYSAIIPFPALAPNNDGDNDNPGGSTPPMDNAM